MDFALSRTETDLPTSPDRQSLCGSSYVTRLSVPLRIFLRHKTSVSLRIFLRHQTASLSADLPTSQKRQSPADLLTSSERIVLDGWTLDLCWTFSEMLFNLHIFFEYLWTLCASRGGYKAVYLNSVWQYLTGLATYCHLNESCQRMLSWSSK